MQGQKEELEEKKAYLRDYRKEKQKQIAIEEELKKIKEDCNVPESLRMDMEGDRGKKKRDLSDYFARIEKLEDELKNQFVKTATRRCKIASMVSELENPKERQVIDRYYVDGLTFAEIAREMNYTTKHITRLHEKALKKIKMS